MVTHPVSLRGYGAAVNDFKAAPVMVKRTDRAFVPGVLDGLRRQLSPVDLGQPQPGTDDYQDGSLRLFQPVHRTFNLLLLEAVCPRPGSPRLDPRSIVSAGFVVRRVTEVSHPENDEGWLLRDKRIVGWGVPTDPTLDPDPGQRPPRLNAGHPFVNGQLSRLFAALEPAAESVAPLFVAPPDVCAAAGRTLLYGLIPVTSSERSEDTPPVVVDPDVVAASMPSFLRALGQSGIPDIADPISLNDVNVSATEPDGALAAFMQELRLIQYGWRVYDSNEGAAILSLLNQITLGFGGGTRPLGDYLGDLIQSFILRTDNSDDTVGLPDNWPQPSATLAAQIRTVVGLSLAARLQAGVPNQQRFDEPDALYRVSAFVRARGEHPSCPPELHWSKPSEPFAIAPWWESGGVPLHTISLPDFDAESIKKIRPNIAFKVPPRLAAMLNQKPDDFLKGNATMPGGGITLGWICSFSIPVITLCAFIVLSLFLVLLNLAFQWMFFIKICLPYPKPQPPSS